MQNTKIMVLFAMSSFKERLKEELSYKGFIVKEFSAKTGINKRTLESYLDSREVIPSADIAVKIANVLGVSVEYLVTGEKKKISVEEAPLTRKYKTVIDDLEVLPQEISSPLVNAIHYAAENERKKQKNITAG